MRARGFTLIELMISTAVTLVVTAAALMVLLTAVRTEQEGARRASLARAAQIVVDSVAQDLKHFGAGVPRGYERDHMGAFVTTPPDDAAGQLRPALRIARRDYLAFVGDLPFPDADLNGIASPVVVASFLEPGGLPRDDRLAVTSELSPCTPPSGTSLGISCDTSDASLVSVGGDDCDGGNIGAPTCPWGLKKWQRLGNESIPLVVGALDGSWMRRKWDMSTTDSVRGRLFIDLDDMDLGIGNQDVTGALLIAPGVGGGFLAHLDRVFYSLEEESGGAPSCSAQGCTCAGEGGCFLRRRHCWGWDIAATEPSDPLFPGVGAPPIRSSTSPADCTAPSKGTRWEDVASGIARLTFRFYAAGGDELDPGASGLDPAGASRARLVEVGVSLVRAATTSSPQLVHEESRRFFLEHAGGLMSSPPTPLAAGGCDDGGPPNECFPQ